jgi:hypothetical protein
MDILAHSLWTGAASKTANLKKKNPIKTWLAIFFGVFPDLFAFTFAFAWSIASLIFPFVPKVEHLGPENVEPVTQNGRFIFHLTHSLYNLSHSLIIFFIIFGLVWLIFRRPIYELFGWLLHILIDIPSHSYRFFPTPFLWPISDFKIDGFNWATPGFMLINYSALILAYSILWFVKRQQNN